MKYVDVNDEDLNVGDIVWDIHPSKLYATKFEVVKIDLEKNMLHVKYIGGRAFSNIKLNETVEIFTSNYTWYREEASND